MQNKYYMMGVCGMGMAPLAAFLKDSGADVKGFDHSPNLDVKSALQKCGVEFQNPHLLEEGRQVVISTALARKRAEIREITGCENIARRGECWAQICASRKLTAVVGSHGKSTVSALAAHAANKLGLDCGYLVGAVPVDFPMHKYCAEGKAVISEIDESDGTIEKFYPEVTVALNADLDHTDTYADNSRLEEMFTRLFARTKKIVVYPKSDEMLSRIAAKSATPSRVVDAGTDFIEINRKMAKAALEETFGISVETSLFDGFKGLLRRQEILCDAKKITVVADYAHHPNEVKSFLKWFCEKYEGDKLVVFQPHRYTRTRRFAEDFARILDARANEADIMLLPVYPASEPFDPLGESGAIASKSKRIMLANSEDFFKMVADKLKESNGRKLNVAIVGAGDFYFTAKDFFRTIK